jgi:large subunit ribosomal protein L30
MPALKITLTKSPIGFEKTQGRTARALGLGKVGSKIVQPDSAPIRGMIKKITHLVAVEEVAGNAPGPRPRSRKNATAVTE